MSRLDPAVDLGGPGVGRDSTTLDTELSAHFTLDWPGLRRSTVFEHSRISLEVPGRWNLVDYIQPEMCRIRVSDPDFFAGLSCQISM